MRASDARLRAAMAAGAVLALLTLLVGGAAAAGSQTPTSAPTSAGTGGGAPSGSASGSAGGATGTMTLVDQSAWVPPVGTFQIRVAAGAVAPDAQVVARIYVPISTQEQLDRTSRGQSLGQRVHSVVVPAAGVPRGRDGSLLLGYPMVADGAPAPDGFLLANPGVYPFSLALEDASGTITSQLMTQLVRLPAATAGGSTASAATTLSVSLVVPYGAPVSHRPDRADTLPPASLDALSDETAALAQYPAVPVAVAPVPETIDTLADHDRTVGSHLVADLRTAVAHRPVLSGTYVGVDSGAWVAHGLADGYDAQLRAGDRALTQLTPAVTGSTAVLEPTATAESLTRLKDHGAAVMVVPSNRLSTTSATPLTQWFDLAASDNTHVSAVAADSALDETLASGPDPVLAAHHVLAALALVSLDHSGSQACVRQPGQPCHRGVALVLPNDAARNQATLTALLAALDAPTGGGQANALVEAASVTGFTHAVDPSSASDRTTTTGATTLRHLDARPVASLGDYPARFHSVSSDITSFATMTALVAGSGGPGGKAADLTSSWNQLTLASGSTQLSGAGRVAYLTEVSADLQGQLDQVTAISQQTVTLTSASGKIPFSISNALPYPVRVLLDLQSPKLHFVHGNQETVVIPAGQPAHLTIPVTVRASGAFAMQVFITSPDKGLAITHTRFDVRSTAISGIGLVLTVAAGVFLALWWIRHARDTRRRRGLVGSTHPVLRA